MARSSDAGRTSNVAKDRRELLVPKAKPLAGGKHLRPSPTPTPDAAVPGPDIGAGHACRRVPGGHTVSSTLWSVWSFGNSWSPGTRRRWTTPSKLSRSITPARTKEMMEATRAISPKVEKA